MLYIELYIFTAWGKKILKLLHTDDLIKDHLCVKKKQRIAQKTKLLI